ncbi:sensor histidine kinase [Caldovatus aquaticus]|uniref:histidine kinase n=1 Tax=Caldovatus aquaticus TaxID=2865671 RepID=A0ABS7F126_9PROT|nr:HWE histidine kinase domain-containing protein [Caldovatus aquaticus]MBW8269330.1 PAS domain-containing protein [Caldovatus aquaticus]
MGGHSVRTHLVLLLFGVLLPVLAFSGIAVWRFAEAEQGRIVAQARDAARDVAAAVERDIAEILTMARVLAASEALEAGDLETFRRQAAAAARVLGATVTLHGPALRPRVALAIPRGGGGPPAGAGLAQGDAEAAGSGQPVVSDLHRDLVAGQPGFAVVLPVAVGARGDGKAHFLAVSFPVARVQRLLQGLNPALPPGAVAGVVDRRGAYVARTRDADRMIGERSLLLADAILDRSDESGVASGAGRDGVPSLVAYRRLRSSGWMVAVSVPEAALRAPLQRALAILGALGAAAVALGLLAALLVGRRLTGAFRALSGAADALRTDAPVPRLATPLREANEIGAALADAAAELRARQAERAAATAALRLTGERFRVALLHAPIIVYACDRELRYTWIANPRGEYDVAALLGRRDEELDFGYPDELSALAAFKRGVIEAGRGARADFTFTTRDGRPGHYDVTAEPLCDATGAVVGATVAMVDVTDRVRDAAALRRQEAHLRLLIEELNHRVKNTLAAVLAIAVQTLRHAADTEEARRVLQDRLLALAAAHDVLTRTCWEGAALEELIRAALAPLRPADPARLRIAGPEVWLPPRAALTLTLAFHELATNAAKYGAFASESGRVTVAWSLDPEGRLRIRWSETGGPPVAPPARRGFGSRLIERSLAHDLGGQARIEFPPAGAVCTIEAPLPLPGAAAPPLPGAPAANQDHAVAPAAARTAA